MSMKSKNMVVKTMGVPSRPAGSETTRSVAIKNKLGLLSITDQQQVKDEDEITQLRKDILRMQSELHKGKS